VLLPLVECVPDSRGFPVADGVRSSELFVVAPRGFELEVSGARACRERPF
jgi:hypothetical protein